MHSSLNSNITAKLGLIYNKIFSHSPKLQVNHLPPNLLFRPAISDENKLRQVLISRERDYSSFGLDQSNLMVKIIRNIPH